MIFGLLRMIISRSLHVAACVCTKSRQSCLTLCNPMGYSPPGFSVHGDSPGKNTGMGCHALLQGIYSPDLGIKPASLRSPSLAGGFFITSANQLHIKL